MCYRDRGEEQGRTCRRRTCQMGRDECRRTHEVLHGSRNGEERSHETGRQGQRSRKERDLSGAAVSALGQLV